MRVGLSRAHPLQMRYNYVMWLLHDYFMFACVNGSDDNNFAVLLYTATSLVSFSLYALHLCQTRCGRGAVLIVENDHFVDVEAGAVVYMVFV